MSAPDRRARRYYWCAFAAILLAGAGMHAINYRLYAHPVEPLALSLSDYPRRIGDWEARAVGLDEEIETVLDLQDYWSASYGSPTRGYVSLLIGYYADEAIAKLHQPTVCYPGAGWPVRSAERIRFPAGAPDGGGIEMNRLIVEKGEQKQMVLYWFHYPGATMADPSLSKLHYLRGFLSGRMRRSMVKVQITAPIIGSTAETMERIEPFLDNVIAQLNVYLGPEWAVPVAHPEAVSYTHLTLPTN